MSTYRSSVIGFSIVTLVMLCLATPVQAKESAFALLQQGNKAFAAGDYAAALEAFKKGNELSPSPAFLRSIGYSHLKLYQHDQAREALKQYLKKYAKQADAKKITELVNDLDVVVETKISVTSTPPGAELYIDAEAAGKVATTPRRNLTIYPGRHLLILKLGKYYPTVHSFTIAPRQNLNFDIALETPLQVESTPPGAEVFIDTDKVSLGRTPLQAGIKPGKHKILVKLAGYKTVVKTVDVIPEQLVHISSTLGVGLRVVSTPPGATVAIDGKRLDGVTPLEEVTTPGEHTVVLSLPGYKSFSTKATVATGGSANLVDAKLQGALLSMRTEPDGATISVDGREMGSAPAERTSVPFGRHELQIKHPDRRTWSTALDFDETHLIDGQVKLARPSWPIWVAGAVAVVGTILGVTGYVLARNTAHEMNDLYAQNNTTTNIKPTTGTYYGPGACSEFGTPATGFTDGQGNPLPGVNCSPGTAHLGTAGVAIAGTAAATGLLYWLIWGRSHAEVRRVPATAAERPAARSAALAR